MSLWHTPMARVIFGILAVTAVVYAVSLGNDFVAYDDLLLVTKNPVAHGVTWQNIRLAFTTFDPELYIPLTLLSYQIEYALFGLNPFIFHLTNLLLHMGSTVFVLLIGLRLARKWTSRPYWVAAGTALLFAVHPLNTEAVAWAAARKDVLSGFLALAALWAYLKADEHLRWYIISVALFALALLSKVSVLFLPVLLLLIDVARRRTARQQLMLRLAPYALLSLLFGVVALAGKAVQPVELSLYEKALLGAKSTAFYLRQFFLPMDLNFVYHQITPVTITRAEFWLPAVLVLLLLAWMGYAIRRRPAVSVGLGWFLLALLPSFLAFWKNGTLSFASDRYAYLAMIGLSFAVCSLCVTVVKQRVLLPLSCIILLTLSILTWSQTRVWQNTLTLSRHSIEGDPRPVVQLNNIGSYYFEKGDLAQAMRRFREAIGIRQLSPKVAANIGRTYARRGQDDVARQWYVLSTNLIPQNRPILPGDLAGYYFLSQYYESVGRPDKSLGMLQEAADLGVPYGDYEAAYNLGVIAQKHRKYEQAVTALRKAVELQPQFLDARYRLAAVLAATGRIPEAIEHLEYVVGVDPQYEQAADHLQNLREMQAASGGR